MSDGLSQRRLNDRHHTIFYIYWDGLRVGSISKREGNPPGTPGWQWVIGVSGKSSGLSDTAGSYDAARAIWKERWPAFRDAQSYAFWKEARETQEYSDRKIAVWDAKKLTSDPKVIAALTDVIGTAGPTPQWVLDMIDGKPPNPPRGAAKAAARPARLADDRARTETQKKPPPARSGPAGAG